MEAETRLALTVDWWVVWRDIPKIRSALIRAHLEHWVPIVRIALDENKQTRRTPGTWTALADALCRDWASLWRSRTGRHGLTQPDWLALATTLNIPVQSLFPQAGEWIATATCYLSPAVALEEARAYAIYRLQNPGSHNHHLDAAIVQEVARLCGKLFRQPGEVEGAILNAATLLGRVLKALGGNKI